MPLLLCTTLHGALTLMGATRDGCFLGKTNVCKPPRLCHSPKRRAHDWPAGLRTSDCLPLGSPHGHAGIAGLVPGGPLCLWCCHLSWICLRPSACWKCPPLAHPFLCFREQPPWFQTPAMPFHVEPSALHLLGLCPLSLDCCRVSQWLWFCLRWRHHLCS